MYLRVVLQGYVYASQQFILSVNKYFQFSPIFMNVLNVCYQTVGSCNVMQSNIAYV
jgi:hypothetical protein